MRYHIIHRTTYTYDSPVTVSHYLARLLPRPLANQECPWHELLIRPEPIERSLRTDYFGNHSVYFEIEGAHQQLEVIARSLVDVHPADPIDPAQTPAWEVIRDQFIADQAGVDYSPAEFRFSSPLIQTSRVFADYALPSFPAAQPIAKGILSLNKRINTDFIFDPNFLPNTTKLGLIFFLIKVLSGSRYSIPFTFTSALMRSSTLCNCSFMEEFNTGIRIFCNG